MWDITVEVCHECMHLFIAVFKPSHEERVCKVCGDEDQHQDFSSTMFCALGIDNKAPEFLAADWLP